MSGRRVVVGIGAADDPLETALRLASRLGAEVVGVCVEDEDWLRMAALPFTRVAGHGPLSRAIDPALLGRALRRRVADMERAFAALAQATVRWSLRVARGRLVPEVLGVAQRDDLVVLAAEALSTSAADAVAGTQVDVLCVRGRAEPRRLVLPAGADGDVVSAVERLAEACGWTVEVRSGLAVPPQWPARDVILAVPPGAAGEVVRRAPCSLLLVRRTVVG